METISIYIKNLTIAIKWTVDY